MQRTIITNNAYRAEGTLLKPYSLFPFVTNPRAKDGTERRV